MSEKRCIFILLSGVLTLQPFPKRQILDAFKLKEFVDDKFKFYENVENSS